MSKIDESITYDIVSLLQLHGLKITNALHDQIKEIVAEEVSKLEQEIYELEDYASDLEETVEDLLNECARQ